MRSPPREIWIAGLGLIVLGLVWQQISSRMFGKELTTTKNTKDTKNEEARIER